MIQKPSPVPWAITKLEERERLIQWLVDRHMVVTLRLGQPLYDTPQRHLA